MVLLSQQYQLQLQSNNYQLLTLGKLISQKSYLATLGLAGLLQQLLN